MDKSLKLQKPIEDLENVFYNLACVNQNRLVICVVKIIFLKSFALISRFYIIIEGNVSGTHIISSTHLHKILVD
jgi:hypothetical protein